jgi:hypothetical protein
MGGTLQKKDHGLSPRSEIFSPAFVRGSVFVRADCKFVDAEREKVMERREPACLPDAADVREKDLFPKEFFTKKIA